MKNSKNIKNAKMYLISSLVFIAFLFSSCKKYLDAKSDSALTIPSSISDAQGLISNGVKMNAASLYLGEASADNYYLSDQQYQNQTKNDVQSIYLWGDNPFSQANPVSNVWRYEYDKIYRANLALETLNKIKLTNDNAIAYNNAKGGALFYRAYSFWKLVSTFSKTYNPATAGTDLGIPLKLSTDVEEKVSRNTVQATYNKIITDLLEAIPLLPTTAQVQERGSKVVVYSLLARIYLAMGNYTEAAKYASQSLDIYKYLLDYNSLTILPTQNSNQEVLFYIETGASSGSGAVSLTNYYVDSALYRSYTPNDRRKTMFFIPNGLNGFTFNPMYGRNQGKIFCGIANDEIYLIKAECQARANQITDAMNTLNYLAQRRYDKTFVNFTASNKEEALQIILSERRKELVLRDLRWSDIKRLNLEGANITLERNIGGMQYILAPNANRYAIPIPIWEVQGLGLEQNPL